MSWESLKTNSQRLEYLRKGKAVEEGIIQPCIQQDLIEAFEKLVAWDDELDFKIPETETETDKLIEWSSFRE